MISQRRDGQLPKFAPDRLRLRQVDHARQTAHPVAKHYSSRAGRKSGAKIDDPDAACNGDGHSYSERDAYTPHQAASSVIHSGVTMS